MVEVLDLQIGITAVDLLAESGSANVEIGEARERGLERSQPLSGRFRARELFTVERD